MELILSNTDLIKQELETEVPVDDIDGFVAKLAKLTSFLGMSSYNIAKAKEARLKKQAEILRKHKDEGLQVSLLIKLIYVESAEEAMLETYTDRVGAGLVHAIDGIRTIISLAKTELEIGAK